MPQELCIEAAARQLLDERLKPDPCAPEVLEVRLIVAITEVPGKCRSTPLAERPMDDTTLLSSFLRRPCRHERVEVLLLDHERERLELRGSSGLSGADDAATQHQRFHHSSALRQAASAVRHLRQHVDRSSANSLALKSGGWTLLSAKIGSCRGFLCRTRESEEPPPHRTATVAT